MSLSTREQETQSRRSVQTLGPYSIDSPGQILSANSEPSAERASIRAVRGPLPDLNSMPDMLRHRAIPPSAATLSVKRTHTGRVSKALKGLRIHNCNVCGKTYTRAEHLRRHQQNHPPRSLHRRVPKHGESPFCREDSGICRPNVRPDAPTPPPRRCRTRESVDGQALVSTATGQAEMQQPDQFSGAWGLSPVPPNGFGGFGPLPWTIEGTMDVFHGNCCRPSRQWAVSCDNYGVWDDLLPGSYVSLDLSASDDQSPPLYIVTI